MLWFVAIRSFFPHPPCEPNFRIGFSLFVAPDQVYAGTLPYMDEAGAHHTTNASLQHAVLAVIGSVLSRAHLLNNDQRFETERACVFSNSFWARLLL